MSITIDTEIVDGMLQVTTTTVAVTSVSKDNLTVLIAAKTARLAAIDTTRAALAAEITTDTTNLALLT